MHRLSCVLTSPTNLNTFGFQLGYLQREASAVSTGHMTEALPYFENILSEHMQLLCRDMLGLRLSTFS